MNLYMIPIIGFEGAVILSIIALVSLGLAGIRFSSGATRSDLKSRSEIPSSAPRRTVAKAQPRTASAAKNTSGFFLRSMSHLMVLAAYPLRLFKRGLEKPPEGSADVSSDPVTSSAPLDLKVAKPNAAGVSAGAEEQDERMDTQTQWDRVSRVVEDGIQKAKEIEALHQAAGRQMDAVDYAYERMLLELSEVLPDINENRSVCRANRDQAYAEAAVAYAADLAKEVAEQLGEKLADTDEPAERKPGKKKAQSETVAA